MHRNLPHVFQKLKEPCTAHAEGHPMMTRCGAAFSGFSLEQGQHGTSTVAGDQQRPAGSGPVLMLREDSQPEGLFIPARSCVSIWNKQFHVIDLFYLE
jgi:hypothetical protein